MRLMMTIVIKRLLGLLLLRVFLEHDVRIPIHALFQLCATRAPVVEQRMR
jgi:hypothetical protein